MNSIQLLLQTQLTSIPSPVIAEQGLICHLRSLSECKLSPSAMSEAAAAVMRSCLLANTNNGIPLSFSSSNNSCNSYSRKKTKKQIKNQKIILTLSFINLSLINSE